MAYTRERLDALPRLGWVAQPTPITALPELAQELGLDWLGVKRDDLGQPLHGGTKLRKLDFCLATPRLAKAEVVVSVGAIGSGHLATLASACAELGKQLHACSFWEPLSAGVLENLATTVSGPTTFSYHHSAVGMALAHPLAVLGVERGLGQSAVLAPGASDATGVVGLLRAGLELAEQIDAGELPTPDRIYIPLGSGGTVAGLALGLGLVGRAIPIHAVATVPRAVARLGRLSALMKQARIWLAAHDLALPSDVTHAPIVIDRGELGPGYGYATPRGLAACARFAPFDLRLEPIYSGKAMAALLRDADAKRAGSNVLFWLTPSAHLPTPSADWEEKLPRALARRLRLARSGGLRRRQLLLRGGLVVGGLALGARVGLYPRFEGFEGKVLAPWQALVLAAAVEAIVPARAGEALPAGPSALETAEHVDRFLVGMSPAALRDIHALFALVEHGTGLDADLRRFTRLDPAARLAFLRRLSALGGPLAQAARGLRDLVYLGFYQDARAWPSIGYRGPLVPPQAHAPRTADDHPRPASVYDGLLAPVGASPAEAWS